MGMAMVNEQIIRANDALFFAKKNLVKQIEECRIYAGSPEPRGNDWQALLVAHFGKPTVWFYNEWISNQQDINDNTEELVHPYVD